MDIWICVVTFALLTFIARNEANYVPSNNFWESVAPGNLLHALDLLTDNVAATPLEIFTTEPKILKRNAHSSSEEESREEHPYNYEQAYEDFVRQYFNKPFDSVESHSASVEEEPLDAQVYKTKPLKNASKADGTTKKNGHCKKVRKNKEICVICKNSKTGENSETCSFSTESEPVNYAYKHENNYKMERHKSEPSSVESSEEKQETKKVSTKEKRPRRKSESKTSSCTKKIEDGKVCYYCKTSEKNTSIKCFKRLPQAQKQKNKRDHMEKVEKKQQRIYKRTASYTYEKNFPNK